MFISILDTYCVELILDKLPVTDAWRFGEAFPGQYEAVNSVWKNKEEINVNDIFPRDAKVLLKVIEKCRNLKKIIYSKKRMDNTFRQVIKAVAIHCPLLEVLGLFLIPLSEKDLKLLCTLTRLKSINLEVPKYSSYLETLFVNNQLLEDVDLKGDIKNTCFRKMPKTIKNFQLFYKPFDDNFTYFNDLIPNINSWTLEKLTLIQIILSKEDVQQICMLTTLVNIRLAGNEFSIINSDIDSLFSNNPHLKEFILYHPHFVFDYGSLRKLSSSLRTLKIYSDLALIAELDTRMLSEYLKTSSIEELHIDYREHTVLAGLSTAAPKLKTLLVSCHAISASNLSLIQELSQLKSLELSPVPVEHGDALMTIAQKCLALEVLALDWSVKSIKPEICAAIAALPKLKLLDLRNINFTDKGHYFFINLSKSLTLATATFDHCPGLTDDYLMMLIRGCRSLTEIRIDYKEDTYGPISDFEKITKQIVCQIAVELHTQTDRQIALYMILPSLGLNTEVVMDSTFHPLLEIVMER